MAAHTERSSSKPRRAHDIQAGPLLGLSWKEEDREASLASVFEHVRKDAFDTIAWYQKARTPKRRVAWGARFLSILLVGAAAFLPLLEGTLPMPVNPLWISLAIAAGVGALALDRALGTSTGWIRCIKTELRIRDGVESFELEWEMERATWEGKAPTPQQVTAMLERAKAQAAQINAIVQEETNAWADEFQNSIHQLDQALQSRAAAARGRAGAARGAVVEPEGGGITSGAPVGAPASPAVGIPATLAPPSPMPDGSAPRSPATETSAARLAGSAEGRSVREDTAPGVT